MTIPFVAPPTIPPPWERALMDHHARVVWATGFGERFADLIEQDDRRLGVTLALSRAVRRHRVAAGARMALHYWLDAEEETARYVDPSSRWLADRSGLGARTATV